MGGSGGRGGGRKEGEEGGGRGGVPRDHKWILMFLFPFPIIMSGIYRQVLEYIVPLPTLKFLFFFLRFQHMIH